MGRIRETLEAVTYNDDNACTVSGKPEPAEVTSMKRQMTDTSGTAYFVGREAEVVFRIRKEMGPQTTRKLTKLTYRLSCGLQSKGLSKVSNFHIQLEYSKTHMYICQKYKVEVMAIRDAYIHQSR